MAVRGRAQPPAPKRPAATSRALVERLAEGIRAAQATPLASDQGHQALRVALAELSEQDREIVTLTAWEGLAPREIARVMGTSANIVRIRLHRARTRIKKQLDISNEALPRSAIQASE